MELANSIHDLIKSLLDLETPFPPKKLYQFSDLSPEDCQILSSAWLSVPVVRRRALLQDLSDLAENDPLLMFEEVGRIGLTDPDEEAAIAAIDLIFEADDKSMLPLLFNLLTDQARQENVRAASANILGRYIFMGEIDKLHPDSQTRIENLLLESCASDPSVVVQRRALESLGYSSRPEVETLIRAASVRNEQWLESALFAIGHSADDQWENLVLDNLEHENPLVSAQAVHAAGELALSRARTRLIKMLDHPASPEILHEAIWALAQIGGEGIEDKFEALLEKAIDDEEANLIEDALELLNFTNGDESFELFDIPIAEVQEGISDIHHHEHLDLLDEDEHEMDEEYEEEWLRYVSDDDLDDDEQSSYNFDEDLEEDDEDMF